MNVYAFITPIILGLLLYEIIYCYVAKKNYYSFQGTIVNVATAIGNQCVNLVVAVFVFNSIDGCMKTSVFSPLKTRGIGIFYSYYLLTLFFIDFTDLVMK